MIMGKEARPCLGYTSIQRIENGIAICIGCEKPVKDHPIAGRTMSTDKGNDMTTEDSTPTQGHLESPSPSPDSVDDIRSIIEQAAQSFEKNPITEGTIWQGYLMPEGLMHQLIPALTKWKDAAIKKALLELDGKLPEKDQVSQDDYVGGNWFGARRIGHNEIIDQVHALIRGEVGDDH